MKKNDLVTGIILIAASIAVVFRYFQLQDHLEKGSGSVIFIRLAFIVFVTILAGAGVKKISSAGKKKSNPESNSNTNGDI